MTKETGRPLFIFTEEKIKEVEVLSGRGLTQKQISDYLGISKSCFAYKMNQNEELRKAYLKGRAKTISYVSGKLIEQINAGNTLAAIFYLKTQAGWKPPQDEESNNKKDYYSNEEVDQSSDNDIKIDTNDPNEAAKIYQKIMTGDKNERNGTSK